MACVQHAATIYCILYIATLRHIYKQASFTPMASALSSQIEIRYVGALMGRYNLSAPSDAEAGADGEKPATYACRTLSLSPSTLVVAAPVAGEIGSSAAFLFDHLGFLKATVTRHVKGGFEARIAGTAAEREALAARIAWLKNHRLRKVADKRHAPRRRPRQPSAMLYLAGGAEETCFVIDLSASGAGVSARIKPPVGTALALGQVPGTVVRHMEHGFAMKFAEPPAPEAIEPAVAARRVAPTAPPA